MTNFGTQVRDHVNDLVPPPDVEAFIDELYATPERVLDRPVFYKRPMLVMAFAAVAVVLVVGVVPFLLGVYGRSDPVTDTPVTTTPVTISPGLADLEWARIPGTISGFPTDSSESLNAVAFGDGILVAVGWTEPPDNQRVVAWTSTDGIEWSRVESLSGPGAISDIAFGDGRFVAVGRADGGGAAWVSDDGITWERAQVEPGVWPSVAYGPGGYVAAGNTDVFDGDFDQVGMWHSGDGAEWERVAEFDTPGLVVEDVAAGPPGYVVTGRPSEGGPGVIFHSVDGVSWTEVALGDEAVIRLLVTYSDAHGFVAIGLDPATNATATVWASDDGLNWRRLPGDGLVNGTEGDAFWIESVEASSDGGIAVAGRNWAAEGEDALVWVSVDGETFDVVPGGEETFGDEFPGGGDAMQFPSGISFVDDRIIILGKDAGFDARGQSVVWIGSPEPLSRLGSPDPAAEPAPATTTTTAPSNPPIQVSDLGVQIEVDGLPCEIVADESGVWVGGPDMATYCTLGDGLLVSTEPGLSFVRRIDPATNQVTAAVDLNGRIVEQAALGRDRLWITTFDLGPDGGQHVLAIDTSADSLLTEWTPSIDCCADVAVGEGAVWVAGYDLDLDLPTVVRLDQETGQPVAQVPIDSSGTLGIAAGVGSVWVLQEQSGAIALNRIDPLTNRVASTTDLGTASAFWGRSFLEVGEGFVWVVVPATCECEGRVLKINPETGEIVSETIVGRYPTALAVGGGFVWVIDAHSFTNTMNPEFLDGAAAENYKLAVIHRVDSATGQPVGAPLAFDQQPNDLAVADGTLWVTHATSQLITRLDITDLS